MSHFKDLNQIQILSEQIICAHLTLSADFWWYRPNAGARISGFKEQHEVHQRPTNEMMKNKTSTLKDFIFQWALLNSRTRSSWRTRICVRPQWVIHKSWILPSQSESYFLINKEKPHKHCTEFDCWLTVRRASQPFCKRLVFQTVEDWGLNLLKTKLKEYFPHLICLFC